MVVCSDLPVGKPLCMHTRTADVCLHIHWHPHWNPKYYESSEPLCLFPDPIFMPVTLSPLSPMYFSVPLYLSLIYLHPKNTDKYYKQMKTMDITYQLTNIIK